MSVFSGGGSGVIKHSLSHCCVLPCRNHVVATTSGECDLAVSSYKFVGLLLLCVKYIYIVDGHSETKKHKVSGSTMMKLNVAFGFLDVAVPFFVSS